MPNLGVPELLIVLVIVAMLFGVGKLPQVFGAVGKGIREFRKETTGEDPVTKQPVAGAAPSAPANPVLPAPTVDPMTSEPAVTTIEQNK